MAMIAYKVSLRLYERKVPTAAQVTIITIASCIELASQFARQSVEESDAPMVPGFHWRVLTAEQIEGQVSVPSMKQILPDLEDD